MEKNKYIPGDLVMCLSQVVKIIEVYQDDTFYLANETSCGQLGIENIEPIPLISSILEKNGWIKTEASYETQVYYKKKFGNRSMTVIFTKDNIIVLYDSGFLRFVEYVSDLQHLLFGLGLNSEMEV